MHTKTVKKGLQTLSVKLLFIPVTLSICHVASPELPIESTALHTTASMQDVGVDLTPNVKIPVML